MIGLDVRVGAVLEKQARLRVIVGRPHERRRACVVCRVRIGAFVEQTLYFSDVAVQHRAHQGRCRKRRRFSSRFVGPFRSPIDPFLDRGNLFCRERSRGRHLHPEPVADQPLIQPARGAVAATDDRSGAAAHRVGAPIEAEPVLMNRRSVAAVAVLPEDRLDVADEIDAGLRRRRGRRLDRQTAGIVRPQRIGERHSRVAQVAFDLVAVRLRPLPHPLHQIVERSDLLRLTEAAVSRDAIDALGEELFVSRCRDSALQDLLQKDRHEQITGAVHGQQRPLDPAVEWRDFFVRRLVAAVLGIGRLASDTLVQTVARKPEAAVDRVPDVRGRDGAILRRDDAGERRSADVRGEASSRRESFEGERPRSAADPDFDAGELASLFRVVGRLAQLLDDLRGVLPDRIGLELDTGNRFGAGADGGVKVEQLRSGGTHRETAGKRGWKFVQTENRDVSAHRRTGQIRALRRAAAVRFREQLDERHRVDETLPGHVAVAPVARRGPGEPFSDEMFVDGVVADAQAGSVLSLVGYVAVGVEHELAVPVVGNLDAVESAVVPAEEHLRACERFERCLAVLPFLLRARHRFDAGFPESVRPCCERGGDACASSGADQSTDAHIDSPRSGPMVPDSTVSTCKLSSLVRREDLCVCGRYAL